MQRNTHEGLPRVRAAEGSTVKITSDIRQQVLRGARDILGPLQRIDIGQREQSGGDITENELLWGEDVDLYDLVALGKLDDVWHDADGRVVLDCYCYANPDGLVGNVHASIWIDGTVAVRV